MTTAKDVQNTRAVRGAGHLALRGAATASTGLGAIRAIRMSHPVAVAIVAGVALNVLLLMVAVLIVTDAPYGWVTSTIAASAALGLVVGLSIRTITHEPPAATGTAPNGAHATSHGVSGGRN